MTIAITLPAEFKAAAARRWPSDPKHHQAATDHILDKAAVADVW